MFYYSILSVNLIIRTKYKQFTYACNVNQNKQQINLFLKRKYENDNKLKMSVHQAKVTESCNMNV